MTKTELLTKTEEYDLIKAAQEGDRDALRVLVERNQGLIHSHVQRFPLKNAQVSYDDLWQVGSLGLIHSVNLFDTSKGLRLSTYAYRWIYAFIRRYFQNNGRVIRIPAHLADRKFQLDREVQSLTQKLGHTPSQEELEALVPGYSGLVSTFSKTISLNQELESGEEILDIQADDSHTDTILHANSLLDLLKTKVSERDYNIFTCRYGVDGEVEMTLNEIGDRFGITRARAHQVVNKCVNLLKVVAD